MLNSRNSSKPPSTDPNRSESGKRAPGDNRPGARKGRNGVSLEQLEDPDEVKMLPIDPGTLPKGPEYREAGYAARQVIEIDIRRFVTE